ncbi:unnamed protein product, partial [Didymodactylos carnosus]
IWKYYSDFENEFIEDTYQKKNEEEVQLGDYVIDFTQMLQIRKDDRTKQRPIRREEVDVSRYLRGERFCSAGKPMKAFTITQYGGSKSTYGWYERNQVLCYPATRYSEILQQAANAHRDKMRLDTSNGSFLERLNAGLNALSDALTARKQNLHGLDQKELTIYRGCKLTEELIEEYTQNVGKLIQWLAFTSTTKDRKVAEVYGNTLFIINL